MCVGVCVCDTICFYLQLILSLSLKMRIPQLYGSLPVNKHTGVPRHKPIHYHV